MCKFHITTRPGTFVNLYIKCIILFAGTYPQNLVQRAEAYKSRNQGNQSQQPYKPGITVYAGTQQKISETSHSLSPGRPKLSSCQGISNAIYIYMAGMTLPPLTGMYAPVMKLARSEARNATTLAIS
jgi:hypothetical protein